MKTAENVQRPTSNVQHSNAEDVREAFEKFVVPSYSRFDLVLERGEGSYVWDVDGKRYLDLAGRIPTPSEADSFIKESRSNKRDRLVTQLSASPEVCHRLREMGVCEEQQIRLVSRQTSIICQVCNARLGISTQLAESILVEPIISRAGKE